MKLPDYCPDTLAAVMEKVDRAIAKAERDKTGSRAMENLYWWTHYEGELFALFSLRRSLARMARNGRGR